MNGRPIAVAATLVNGALAGASIDRTVVQFAAFRRLGAERWAEFSRHADLSLRGIAIYPTEGIGGTLFSIAAAVALARNRARIAATSAAVLAVIGLALTIKAGPNMLSLRKQADPQKAFDGFQYWSRIRAAFQISAFVANVATLALID